MVFKIISWLMKIAYFHILYYPFERMHLFQKHPVLIREYLPVFPRPTSLLCTVCLIFHEYETVIDPCCQNCDVTLLILPLEGKFFNLQNFLKRILKV